MFGNEYGTIVVALTEPTKCTVCNNLKLSLVRIHYSSITVLGFTAARIGADASFTVQGVDKICPVCETRSSILPRLFLNTYKSQSSEWQTLYSLLHTGRSYTKAWIDNMNPSDRTRALKRLMKIRAYDLIKFVES